MELCARIMNRVRDFSFYGEDRLPSGALTVSIGAACFPDDAQDSADLLRCADEAMYKAKGSGKNRIRIAGVI
jgi:diguanylate cyclase (GGDEF)-like protein